MSTAKAGGELWIGSDLDVTLYGLQGTDGDYINGATVAWALKTAAGGAISGGSGSCTYESGSNGDYRGTIPASVTATLTADTAYRVEITVSGTANDFRRIEYKAKYRGAR